MLFLRSNYLTIGYVRSSSNDVTTYFFEHVRVFVHGLVVLLETSVDDEVAVEERPLALDVLKDTQLPWLVVKTARILK